MNALGEIEIHVEGKAGAQKPVPALVDIEEIGDSSGNCRSWSNECLPTPPEWQSDWYMRIPRKGSDWKTWMWLRPSRALMGNYDETWGYALTIDGYAYAEERWGRSGVDKVPEIEGAGLDNASFEDLRACLFFIQRGIKWTGGSGPVDGLEARFHACYAAVCRAWDREWRQQKVPPVPPAL